MRARVWSILRLWLLGLVALWAVCVLATSSTDPAAPLATLLVTCGGALLLLGAAPAEDLGRVVSGPLPEHAAELEEWRLFAVAILCAGAVLLVAAVAWGAAWRLAGSPPVALLRVLAVAAVVLAAAYLAGVVGRAAWLSRQRKRPRPRIRTRDVVEFPRAGSRPSSRRDLLECGGMGRHRIAPGGGR